MILIKDTTKACKKKKTNKLQQNNVKVSLYSALITFNFADAQFVKFLREFNFTDKKPQNPRKFLPLR